MTDQTNIPKKNTPPGNGLNGYAFAALAIMVSLCVLGVMFEPAYRWQLFALIVGLFVAGFTILRSLLVETTSSLRGPGYVDLEGRDALICQSMAEALRHPAYILDQRAIVRYSNKSATSTFGNMRIGEWLFIKFRQPDLRRSVEEGLHSQTPMRTDFNETIPDDRWFSVEMSPIPRLFGEDPKQDKLFVLSFYDLTEVKRIDKMRSDFIANASHELRTPLASLLGYIETIKGPARKDAKAIDRFTGIMLDQARRMTRLVNDLLSLSRIEMQAHVRPSDTVNLTEIISSVAVSLDEVAKQMGVEIEYQTDEAVYVTGDRDELLQVFENIVENACKYGQEGEKVVISLDVQESDGDKSATVSVQDFGPGINIEDQHRITERFYRVDVARSREKQGTGLGLAIVKHILNRHGTRLNIYSKVGAGATFSV